MIIKDFFINDSNITYVKTKYPSDKCPYFYIYIKFNGHHNNLDIQYEKWEESSFKSDLEKIQKLLS